MKLRIRARSSVALALLMVFTVGVTPQIYMHNIVADHTDELFTERHSQDLHLDSYHFTCGFVNVINVTPFVPGFVFTEILTPDFISPANDSVRRLCWHLTVLSSSLRGPPTV